MSASPLFVAVVSLAAERPANDAWECPGFPCMIVNFMESKSKYSAIHQTCQHVGEMDVCNHLIAGESFSAYDAQGKVIGTHHLVKPHSCVNAQYGCWESECPQGSLAMCQDQCHRLNLLEGYMESCHDGCAYMCSSRSRGAPPG